MGPNIIEFCKGSELTYENILNECVYCDAIHYRYLSLYFGIHRDGYSGSYISEEFTGRLSGTSNRLPGT
jgi:hypothetical protein